MANSKMEALMEAENRIYFMVKDGEWYAALSWDEAVHLESNGWKFEDESEEEQ